MHTVIEATSVDANTTPQTVGDGLRQLADFYDAHPDLPPLSVVMISHFGGGAAPQIAAWVDGLDELEITKGTTSDSRYIVRHFGPLDVRLHAYLTDLGEQREVQTTAVEMVPFTVDQLRERANPTAAPA